MKFKKYIKSLTTLLIILGVFLNVIIKNDFVKSKLANIYFSKFMTSVTTGMKYEKDDYITYYYRGVYPTDSQYINYLRKHIAEAEKESSKYLGNTNKYSLNIITFDTYELFGDALNVNPDDNISRYQDGSIYINRENVSPYVLAHEYTHYKMDSFFKDKKINSYNLPAWYEEGVSEYISSTFEINKFKDKSLNKIQDFKKLDNNTGVADSVKDGYDPYFQSYLAIRKLVEIKGEGTIEEILIKVKSMDFYDAFEKVVGMTIEDFENLLKIT